MPLTEHGRAQARGLAPLLRHWEFAAIFTSPRSRALDTCALAGYGDRAQVLDDLAEWDYGEYEGLTGGEILARRPGWLLWRDGVPGGETLDHVAARAERVIARAGHVEGAVLLVSHGHLLRILTARWLDLPARAGQRLALGTAAPSVLGYEHEWTALRRWNIDPSA